MIGLGVFASYWREALIVALAGSLLIAVKSCSHAQDETARIKAEDMAIARIQEAENEAHRKQDKSEFDHARKSYEDEIASLKSDTRVASVKCVRNPPRPGPVPGATAPAAGTPAETPADIPRETTFDPGPELDQLTRECDALAVEHNKLVDWLIATH